MTVDADIGNIITLNTTMAYVTNISNHAIHSANISALHTSSNNMSCTNILGIYAQMNTVFFKEPGEDHGLIRKQGDVLQIIGGVPTPANIGFSTDGVTYPMVFDGELNISSQINASFIDVDQLYAPDAYVNDITSETTTTDKLLLREPNDLGYEYSYLARDEGVLQLVGKNLSTDPDVDIDFFLGQASGTPIMHLDSTGVNVSILNVSNAFVNNVSADRYFIQESGDQSQSASIIREGNQVKFIGKLDPTDVGSDYLFFDNEGHSQPKLQINSASDYVIVRALQSSGDIISETLNTSTINSSTINSSNLYISDIYSDGLITTNGNISCVQIEADLSLNLSAGANITLTTVAGITTIDSSGGSVDPLNISVGNISILSVSMLNADIIEGFTKSTQYCFQATSSINATQEIWAGTRLFFNDLQFIEPAGSTAYIENNKEYTCPVDGVYCFGFKLLVLGTPTSFSVGFYKNMSLIGYGGQSGAQTESLSLLVKCVAGDIVGCEGVSGFGNVYMAPYHSWWYGNLLSPDNLLITSTTDLTVASINASTGNINTLECTTISGDISANLVAGTNITLTTLGGITTINSSGGGVTDPLNISVGNISTLSISNGTCDGNFTTSNLVTGTLTAFDTNMSYLNVSTLNVDNINVLLGSSQYAWNATSTLVTNQSLYANNTLQFDSPDFSYPPSAYVGNGYVVQPNAGGLYAIGFKCFMNTVPTYKCRLSIYKNATMMFQGGDDVAGSEGYDTILALLPGDKITIRLTSGTTPINVYMGPTHSWFYGHLIEPINQSINTTTNLIVESLTTTDINVSNVSVTDITTTTIDGQTANISTLNSSTCNASAGIFPILTTITINTRYANSQVYNTSSLNASAIYADGLITTFGNMSCVELEVETINASTANSSTINVSTINTSAFGGNLVGKSSVYSRVTTSQFYSPPGTTTEYVNFQAEVYANTDLFTYVTPVDGGANEGFICQKAGYYKIDYSVQCFSINYQNRIQWLMIPILNNTNTDGKSQGYTRAGVLGAGFVWACNCTSSMVLFFEVNDYFGLKIKCAKNDTTADDNFDSTGIDIGSTCNFQYLGT
jgi:hypothetical protein